MRQEIKNILRSLYLEAGDEVFSDKNRLRSALSDLLVPYPTECKLLKLAASEDIGRRILEETHIPLKQRISVYSRKLADSYSINIDACYDVIETLAYAISGDESLYNIRPEKTPTQESTSHKPTILNQNVASTERTSNQTSNLPETADNSSSSKNSNSWKLLPIIIVAALLIMLVAKACGNSSKSTVQTVSTNNTNTQLQTSSGNNPQQKSSSSLHDLKTLSTEWGTGDGNYWDESVTDYYGNEYFGYYDFAAIDNPYPSFSESFIRVATKGEWKYLSGTYFPRAWESGDYYVRLSIYADDTLVYQGDWMGLESKSVSFNVDIRNCDVLKIVVDSQKTESLPYITPGIDLVNATVSN